MYVCVHPTEYSDGGRLLGFGRALVISSYYISQLRNDRVPNRNARKASLDIWSSCQVKEWLGFRCLLFLSLRYELQQRSINESRLLLSAACHIQFLLTLHSISSPNNRQYYIKFFKTMFKSLIRRMNDLINTRHYKHHRVINALIKLFFPNVMLKLTQEQRRSLYSWVVCEVEMNLSGTSAKAESICIWIRQWYQ